MNDTNIFKHFFFIMLLLFSPISFIFPEPEFETIICETNFNVLYWEMAKSKEEMPKLILLAYIEDNIEYDYIYNSTLPVLIYVASEHIKNPIIVDNKIINNFPNVRLKAVRCLGKLGTKEAYNSLKEIITFEDDPRVLQEAIEIKNLFDASLGKK